MLSDLAGGSYNRSHTCYFRLRRVGEFRVQGLKRFVVKTEQDNQFPSVFRSRSPRGREYVCEYSINRRPGPSFPT